jgi:hypothetical protein
MLDVSDPISEAWKQTSGHSESKPCRKNLKSMKTLQKLLFLVVISQSMPFLLTAQAAIPVKSTNPEKPMIFSGLPEKFDFAASTLKQLFTLSIKESVAIPLSHNIVFKGTVVAKVQRNENVLSVNILSTNFPGTLLNISLIHQPNQPERIIGRFMNPASGDVLLIEQENDRFYITKDLQKFVMTDCPLPETAEQVTHL